MLVYLHGMLGHFKSIAFLSTCKHCHTLHQREIALRHSGNFESLGT